MTAATTATTPATSEPVTSTTKIAWTPALWAAAVLRAADLPVTTNNITNLLHWLPAENHPNDWWATTRNNPLNAFTGGFRKFDTLAQSATATGQLLKSTYSGIEGNIWTVLAATADLGTFSHAVVASHWATSHYGGTPTHLTTTTPSNLTAPSTAGTPSVFDSFLASVNGATASTTGFHIGALTWIHSAYHWLNTHGLGSGATAVTGGSAGVGKAVTSTLGGLAAFTKLATKLLTSLTFWRRVGIFIGGATLFGAGLFILAQSSKSVRSAETTAGTAAALA